MRNEKSIYGGLSPYNSRLLTKNLNKNLDTFYLDHETPTIYKQNCKGIKLLGNQICNIAKNKINRMDKIILLGKYEKDKLNIYWNLDTKCIDIDQLFIFYKIKDSNDDYKLIKIDYIDKSFNKRYRDHGKLTTYVNINRINYNFVFKYPQKYTTFIYIKFINGEDLYSNIFD
jgi:hypothetical protein